MAHSINFVLDAGTLFEAVATIENEDGSLYDLSNKTPHCQMAKSYYTSSKITIDAVVEGDPQDGQIKLTLLPDESQDLRSGRYVYDVEVHSDTDPNYVKRVLQGLITVHPQVTRTS